MGPVQSIPTKKDENVETYSLIWLDGSVNESEENIQAQEHLRQSIHHLITFENDQKCLEYIESVSRDDRIVLIVSGKLGQIIVPKIVQFRQINSIYIYCMNKRMNEYWAQHYSKVKGVFIEFNELINQIKSDQVERQQYQIDESLSINIFNSDAVGEGQSTSELNSQFLYSQLLIDCLIRMKSTSNEKNELISFCKEQYKDNNDQFKILKEFEKNYSPKCALWWYTRPTFLYRLLNKALRIQNVDLLHLFRFFIRDIGKQLKKHKCLTRIHVYRTQTMSKEEIEMLKKSIGQFIMINSFLSTSLNYDKAQSFFSVIDGSNDLEKVLFQIDADPTIENIKSFSNLTSHSFYPDEEEILFMVGSIFRLNGIKHDQNGIWIIQMSLSSINDHHLQKLFKRMQQQLGNGKTNILHFGQILKDMGKLEHAEKYLLRLLNQLLHDHQNITNCCLELGIVAYNKGDYEASLNWYNKSLEIQRRTLEPHHPNIASTHNNMANVYQRKGDYDRALQSYNEALNTLQKAFENNHSKVALCLNNMAFIYKKQKKYSKALEVYVESLSIRKKYLPVDHPDLADSYISIGSLHSSLNDYDLALENFHLSLNNYTKSLPPEHPRTGLVLEHIAGVHENKNELEEALSYYEEAASIYRHSYISTHPDVIKIEESIRRVSPKLTREASVLINRF